MALAWPEGERLLEDEFDHSVAPHRVCSRQGWDDRQPHSYLGAVWPSGSLTVEALPAVGPAWWPVSDLATDVADDSHEEPCFVSSSGLMLLPASVRHRWNLDDGGPVEVVDLGFAVLALPPGAGPRLLDAQRDAAAYQVNPLSSQELSLMDVEHWAPAEDWSDWADATR